MESVIVYKRVSARNQRAILAALREGYMVLMPQSNGVPVEEESPEPRRIFKRRRVARRRGGKAPQEAKRLRNQEMAELRNNGWSISRIGKRYGLSAGRVWQITNALKQNKEQA